MGMNVINVYGTAREIERLNAEDCTVITGGKELIKVNLVDELGGKSTLLREYALLSKQRNLVIYLLFQADLYNMGYLSVAVIERGKILSICDMTHMLTSESFFDLGDSFRVIRTRGKKVGVLVGDDVYFPECARALVLSGAEYLLIAGSQHMSEELLVAMRALSLFNGVKTIYHFADGCGALGVYGEELSKEREFRIEIEGDKRVLLARRPDIYNDIYHDG